MKNLIIAASAFGGILLFLLASASANTALFARHYPWLLGLNAIVALSLFALVGWQVRVLWQEHRAKVFGSRLKLRLASPWELLGLLRLKTAVVLFVGAALLQVPLQFPVLGSSILFVVLGSAWLWSTRSEVSRG